MNRVDPTTMICKHGVLTCEMCMVDDFYDAIDERREKRRRYKQEWRETPTNERFELGGEG